MNIKRTQIYITHEVPVSLYLNYNFILIDSSSPILIFLPDSLFLLHKPPLQSSELITCNKFTRQERFTLNLSTYLLYFAAGLGWLLVYPVQAEVLFNDSNITVEKKGKSPFGD